MIVNAWQGTEEGRQDERDIGAVDESLQVSLFIQYSLNTYYMPGMVTLLEMQQHIIIHSFNKYLLNNYKVSHIILGAGDITVVPTFRELTA